MRQKIDAKKPEKGHSNRRLATVQVNVLGNGNNLKGKKKENTLDIGYWNGFVSRLPRRKTFVWRKTTNLLGSRKWCG